jgi:hypothetical protein
MKTERRAYLKDVMLLAWGLYRAELNGPSPRTFADALTGAWRWMKGNTARAGEQPRWAQGSRPRTVSFGTMLQSPIRRSMAGQAYAGTRAAEAGYLTSIMGR